MKFSLPPHLTFLMEDYPEDPMPMKDEIEDPIYEEDLPREKTLKIRPIEVNLHKMLLGICQDVEEGRFPLFCNKILFRKTKGSKTKEALGLAILWVKALERERLSQNQGAIFWTKLLESFPGFLQGEIPEDAENWALQLRRWRH
jgi:hypothetical protein